MATLEMMEDPLPPDLVPKVMFLPDASRAMGLRIVAPPGAGKSRLLGRYVTFMDFVRNYPTVLIDPIGQSIDNLLDRICRLSEHDQKLLWPRVVYIDLGAEFGKVTPLPIYYRRGDESLYTISQRFLDVVRRADPDLRHAPLLGWNAVASVGEVVGMALAALGMQLSESDLLLEKPEQFLPALIDLIPTYPELSLVVEFFKEHKAKSKTQRDRETLAFRRTVAPLRLDPKQRALYCADGEGLNFEEIESKRQLVLFDLRNVESDQARRFAMLWVFRVLREHLFRRGTASTLPLSLAIDELTYLLPADPREDDVLTEDLVELTSRIARNHNVWLTLSHQDLNQVSPRVQNVLMRMGTQIFGGMSDPDMVDKTARRYVKYDPYAIRKIEPVYAGVPHYSGRAVISVPEVIDYRTQEYTYDEQVVLFSERLYGLKPMEFEVALGNQQGSLPRHTRRVSLANIEKGIYPDLVQLITVRAELARRQGIPIDEALTGISDRQLALAARSKASSDSPPPRRAPD